MLLELFCKGMLSAVAAPLRGRTCPGKQGLDAGLFHKNMSEAGGGYHMVLVGD